MPQEPVGDRHHGRSSSSTVQYRCPDGNLTGNARISVPSLSWSVA